MAISTAKVEYITPTKAELQPFHKIHCEETECGAVFTNAGNYELHLQRHHKIMPKRDNGLGQLIRFYYCPDAECVYHFSKGTAGRHFKHMKNLRQHFQKIHFKNFICEQCGRAFPTEGQLKKHAGSVCGKRFNCGTCNWNFETKDALILHRKRKGHVMQADEAQETQGKPLIISKSTASKRSRLEKSTDTPVTNVYVIDEQGNSTTAIDAICTQHKDTQTKIVLPCMDSFSNTSTLYETNTQCHDSETQTEQFLKACMISQTSILDSLDSIYHDTETQTDTSGFISMNCNATRNVLDDFQGLHHDIQTQTELSLQQRSQGRTTPINDSNSGRSFLDQMLAQTSLAHMHTQTCDDYLLSELGLTDIQTQTNWTSFTEGTTNATSTTSTSTTGFLHDELLVSTETQTSFTQCLLDSTDVCRHITTDNAATCTASSGIGEESNTSNYVHLYNTQQTQTCDLLLEGLFGGQENDLIAGFQSTYTQT